MVLCVVNLQYNCKNVSGGVMFKLSGKIKYLIYLLVFISSGCADSHPTVLPEKMFLKMQQLIISTRISLK